ncbi:pyridoxal-phosphate dependent enzyme [Pelolinea submarina]|uniref:Threonine synthase n=1 Tax=Pelolinea submarina TaxID=913107 RepID=A0A347ZWD0_9CHLR|nr:pyridoxal-phosphate dependent enzyme [Pelolinea submarina]REG05353.1 threonine synthase [Pelolinea submarina]BBB49611.1 threonine synthase [Pelolinea submarina]
MLVICDRCHHEDEFDPRQFRCKCGGAWEPWEFESYLPNLTDPNVNSVWCYQEIMGLSEVEKPLSLGAGQTPLIGMPWDKDAAEVFFKLEYISPTGSFKDRGTEVEANYLASMGIRDVVEDSSGNAGASLAAYAARTGLHAAIFAPDRASPAKLAQIEVYGADLRRIPGPRAEATRAALAAVEAGAVYASHAYNPAYLLGQKTFAWECWEQLGGHAPDALVISVGQGGLLLGAWLGFKGMLKTGLVKRMPRLFAAQPELLAPIARAFNSGADEIEEIIPVGKSLAEGLAIVKPVRGHRILQALRESGGAGLTVSEAEIRAAYYDLARHGMFAEPSSAAAAAVLPQVRKLVGEKAKIIVALTGSGLKSPIEN